MRTSCQSGTPQLALIAPFLNTQGLAWLLRTEGMSKAPQDGIYAKPAPAILFGLNPVRARCAGERQAKIQRRHFQPSALKSLK
jgi:hypothetical protein